MLLTQANSTKFNYWPERLGENWPMTSNLLSTYRVCRIEVEYSSQIPSVTSRSPWFILIMKNYHICALVFLLNFAPCRIILFLFYKICIFFYKLKSSLINPNIVSTNALSNYQQNLETPGRDLEIKQQNISKAHLRVLHWRACQDLRRNETIGLNGL